VARFLLVCCGGALGTGARFLVSTGVAQAFGTAFPRGTLLINVSGSFLIALVMELSLVSGAVSQNARLFLTAGVMGGYTTYSSFNHETLGLAARGRWPAALLYVALTVVGGLVAGFLGLVAARAIARAPAGEPAD
jgi:fluoride exporter